MDTYKWIHRLQQMTDSGRNLKQILDNKSLALSLKLTSLGNLYSLTQDMTMKHVTSTEHEVFSWK